LYDNGTIRSSERKLCAKLYRRNDIMISMEPLDPETERQRLLARYSSMAEQQLEQLAREWESLTDPARLALKQEMERRGFNVELQKESARDKSACAEEESAPENSICSGEFVTIREIDFPGEAMVVQGFLESAGIKTSLVDALNLPLDLNSQVHDSRTKLCIRKTPS
jgi:hypothetical protein